jgi:hypothetical protein
MRGFKPQNFFSAYLLPERANWQEIVEVMYMLFVAVVR